MWVRPARSSSFPDPDELEPDDLEPLNLEMEQAVREPEDADPSGLDGPYPDQWQRLWTPEQIADLDDLASYLDYVWEMTNEEAE